MRPRDAWPLLLAVLALGAAAALPWVASAWTSGQRGDGIASALRAHVAWSRAVALGLALAAAVALARLRRRDPAGGARQGAAILVAASVLAVAAALPLHDAWADARIEARYLAAPGWARLDTWSDGPLAFGLQREAPAHEGTLRVPMPDLAEGDAYQAFVSFAAGDPEGFYRAQVAGGNGDACVPAEGQTPRGGPRAVEPAPRDSHVFLTCVVREPGPHVLTARWGRDEPVDMRVAILLEPAYANAVQRRVDESVSLAAGALALAAFAALALTTPRSTPRTRAELAALAMGPSLACASWAAAALAPASLEASRAAAAGFALAAVLAALAIAAAAWRRPARAADALAWSAFLAAGIAAFATVPAARVWAMQVPWVVLGMLGTLAVAGLALVAARRMSARAAA